MAAIADVLGRPEDYRVLRRLVARAPYTPTAGQGVRTGILLDTETTGLDHRKDELIELGMVKFDYLPDGRIVGVRDTFFAFNEPSERATRLSVQFAQAARGKPSRVAQSNSGTMHFMESIDLFDRKVVGHKDRREIRASYSHLVDQADELEVSLGARGLHRQMGHPVDAESQKIGDLKQRLLARSGIPTLIMRSVAEDDVPERSIPLPLSFVDDHRQRHGKIAHPLFDFHAQQHKGEILAVRQIETVQDALESFDPVVSKGPLIDRLDDDRPPVAGVDAAEGFDQPKIPFVLLERPPRAIAVVDVDEMKFRGGLRQQFAHVFKAISQLPSDFGDFAVFEKNRDMGPPGSADVPRPSWTDGSVRIVYGNVHRRTLECLATRMRFL